MQNDEIDFDELLDVTPVPEPDPFAGVEEARRGYSSLAPINPAPQIKDSVKNLRDTIENQGRLINERGRYLSWLAAAITAVPPDDETSLLIARTLDNLYI
jgi:hypothetical protein